MKWIENLLFPGRRHGFNGEDRAKDARALNELRVAAGELRTAQKNVRRRTKRLFEEYDEAAKQLRMMRGGKP
jgi:hypothetical protein